MKNVFDSEELRVKNVFDSEELRVKNEKRFVKVKNEE